MATDQLSRVFSALADPTRREILLQLGAGQATVGELAAQFPISLPAVSRHLKVLEAAGLISRDRRAQWRTSALRAEALGEANGWIDHLTRVWDQRFDRLDAHLAALQRAAVVAHSPGSAAPSPQAPTPSSEPAARSDAPDVPVDERNPDE